MGLLPKLVGIPHIASEVCVRPVECGINFLLRTLDVPLVAQHFVVFAESFLNIFWFSVYFRGFSE